MPLDSMMLIVARDRSLEDNWFLFDGRSNAAPFDDADCFDARSLGDLDSWSSRSSVYAFALMLLKLQS
jgi:hypothetical protein